MWTPLGQSSNFKLPSSFFTIFLSTHFFLFKLFHFIFKTDRDVTTYDFYRILYLKLDVIEYSTVSFVPIMELK